jgi:hypothetical protein
MMARPIQGCRTSSFRLGGVSRRPEAYLRCGDYVTAKALADEMVALADKGQIVIVKAFGRLRQGRVAALIGKCEDAAEMITSGLMGWRSTGATLFEPMWLSSLASARAELTYSVRRRLAVHYVCYVVHRRLSSDMLRLPRCAQYPAHSPQK